MKVIKVVRIGSNILTRQSGTSFLVELRFAGFVATMNGEIAVELVSKQKWGAF